MTCGFLPTSPGELPASSEHFVASCAGKTQYASRGDAVKVLLRMAKRKRVRRNSKRHLDDRRVPYKCPHCHQWHLGSNSR